METFVKILVVDDNPDIRDVLHIQLTNRGYYVQEAANGREAIRTVEQNPEIDLIILDIMMPVLSGLETCTEIRKISSAPILFLTAKSKETDKEAAYFNGGDDYLVKPFSQSELMMKVESLLRRYFVYKGKDDNTIPDSDIRIRNILINPTTHCVRRDGQKVDLTDTEFQVLMYLVKKRGEPQNAQAIYENVWHEKFLPASANTIMVHIVKLRKKLEADLNEPLIIRTIWGKGYQIDEI